MDTSEILTKLLFGHILKCNAIFVYPHGILPWNAIMLKHKGLQPREYTETLPTIKLCNHLFCVKGKKYQTINTMHLNKIN